MSAVDTALDGLRALIADGLLQTGDRLPSENDLCASLAVSRGPLREAIRTLEACGVLVARRGSGTYVSDLRAKDLIASMSLTVGLLPLRGALEYTSLRRILEPHAAALAAARIDQATLHNLGLILDRIEASDDVDEQSRLDHEFHMAITATAGNDVLASLIEVFRTRLRAHRITDPNDAAALKMHSDASHRAILRALDEADPEAAAAAAATHVAYTEHWVRRYVEDASATNPVRASSVVSEVAPTVCDRRG